MKGNLLIDIDSFRWENLNEDRKEAIESLGLVLNLATDYGDSVYGHPEMWNINLAWGLFHDILYLDENERIEQMPWLTDVPLSILGQLFNYLRPTECESCTLEDLNDIEFSNQLNGLLSLQENVDEIAHISNPQTWFDWHKNYFISNPPERNSFVEALSPFFPNLHFNPISVPAGLNGLHTSYKTIFKTILYHLTALNDDFYPKFKAEPKLGGDGVCDYLEELYKTKDLKLGASRDKNTCTDITFVFRDVKEGITTTKELYCDLHTKFWDYFESGQTGYNASGNRIYFHQPIEGFLKNKLLIGRIGKHADC